MVPEMSEPHDKIMIYGPKERRQLHRRIPHRRDCILRGTKRSELPVQLPVKVQLTLNLKTAKALGIEVPVHLQQLADEVIE